MPDQASAVALLSDELRAGDVILVKGSRYRTWDIADDAFKVVKKKYGDQY